MGLNIKTIDELKQFNSKIEKVVIHNSIVQQCLIKYKKRQQLTRHSIHMYICICLHDEAFHVNNKCIHCKCKHFKQNRLIFLRKLSKQIIINNNNNNKVNETSIRLSKSKIFWKYVESSLVKKGESPIMK